jgi:hypothetical protein
MLIPLNVKVVLMKKSFKVINATKIVLLAPIRQVIENVTTVIKIVLHVTTLTHANHVRVLKRNKETTVSLIVMMDLSTLTEFAELVKM